MNPLYKTVYRHYKVVWLAGLLKPSKLMTETEFFDKFEKDKEFRERGILLKNEFKYLIKEQKKIIYETLKKKLSMTFWDELEKLIESAPPPETQTLPRKGDYGYNSSGEYGVITEEEPVMTDNGLAWQGLQLRDNKGLPWQSKNPTIIGHMDL